MTEIAQNFTKETGMSSGRILLNVNLLRPYYGHVLPILGQCLGYFYNIFTSRCLNWLKFSVKSHACQIEEYHLVSNYWTIKGPCLGQFRAMFCYIYNIFTSRCLKWLKFSVKSQAYQLVEYFIMRNFGTIQWPCLG